MKHLKKKLLRHQKLPEIGSPIFQTSTEIAPTDINKKLTDDHFAYLITDKDEMIGTFKFRNKKTSIYIPEPDLVVCLFETARFNFSSIENYRTKLKAQPIDLTVNITNSYNFFATASITISLLFNAFEAFVNRTIPHDYKYELVDGRQTTIQSKSQIERHTNFRTKVEIIIPSAIGKDFCKVEHGKYQTLLNFKTLRDDLTHMKSFDASRKISYDKLYTDMLKFDYSKALHAAKDYINFYSPNLIELCDCGSDF